MKIAAKASLFASLVALSSAAVANELEGSIEAVDASGKSFVAQGIELVVTEATEYENGLKAFSDLHVGQRVEVDFEYREQTHYATEIELEK